MYHLLMYKAEEMPFSEEYSDCFVGVQSYVFYF